MTLRGTNRRSLNSGRLKRRIFSIRFSRDRATGSGSGPRPERLQLNHSARPIDITAPSPTVPFMGDKSPKANRKQAAQKNEKHNASEQKKKAAITAKQTPKK